MPLLGKFIILFRQTLLAQTVFNTARFGNIGSVGNQIGVFMQLAPKRTGDFARIAPSALLTGVTATLMSASIAGMVLDRTLPSTAVAA